MSKNTILPCPTPGRLLDHFDIFSFDTAAFIAMTNDPTRTQCDAAAGLIVDHLPWMLEDHFDDVDRSKWPLTQTLLAAEIKKRLCSKDWYSGLLPGDAEIWNTLLEEMITSNHAEIGLDLQRETSGMIDARVVSMAVKNGARLLSPKKFGRTGFRHENRLRYDPQLIYSIHLPEESQEILNELERIAPFFSELPPGMANECEMFESGLLKPIRRIVKTGRSMWVQWQH